MATVVCVDLTEDDPAYDLVTLIHGLEKPSAAEEKLPAEPKAEKTEDGESKEEDVDPVLKKAKESALGKLVEKRDYVTLLNGPGGLLEAMPKLMQADPDVIEAGFSLGFAIFQKSEAVRAEAAKKRAEERDVQIKAGKKKKKTEPEIAAMRETWSKTEAQKVRGEEQARDNIIKGFLKALTDEEKSTKEVIRLRLSLLSCCFNMLEPTSSLRHTIFMSILKYARTTSHLHVLEGQFEHLDGWVKEWKLSGEQLAELYLTVSEIVSEDKRQVYILEYLKHLEEFKGPERSSPQTKAIAARACITALNAYKHSDQPAYDCHSLLNYKLIQELGQDTTYGPLVELVNIFANKTITEYLVFHKVQANAKCLTDNGLSHDEICSTLRTLTLCWLGSETERLPFADLKKKLEVSDNFELEAVVIEAVMTGRLQAKIDQEKEELVIQRTTARIFQEKDWAPLAAKMERWSEKVAHVLANMHPERGFQG